MDAIVNFLVNAEGLYDLGSMIKLFTLMIGIDGMVMTIFAIVRGFNSK